MILAAVFFVAQIFAGGGINWGLWALVFSTNMTTFWVKYTDELPDLKLIVGHNVLQK